MEIKPAEAGGANIAENEPLFTEKI